MADMPTGLELRSLITDQGQLRITLEPVDMGEPGPGEIIVRVEATPLNPSDLGLLLGPADMATSHKTGLAIVPPSRRESRPSSWPP